MDNPDVIEGFLIRSGLVYDSVETGLWIIHDEGESIDNIVVTVNDPIVVLRVKLKDAPTDASQRAALFEKLLELNATDMVTGAYGLESNAVVITETLQTAHLEEREFEVALDGLTLAVSQHYESLKSYLSNADAAG